MTEKDEQKKAYQNFIDNNLWKAQELKVPDFPIGYIPPKVLMPKKDDPLDRQVGGDHYKNFPIQPVEYIRKNGLGWFEGNVIKYVTRHRFKNKRQDIEKAIHMLECILKEYDNGDLT